MTPEDMRGAELEGRYRYRLWRRWRAEGPTVAWVMLNPSTADGSQDDATLRRCMGFSQTWGYAGLEVLNLFALRATDPRELQKDPDAIGPHNDLTLRSRVGEHQLLVAGWGNVAARLRPRVRELGELLAGDDVEWRSLGRTNQGQPRHPLYVRGDQRLEQFEWPRTWDNSGTVLVGNRREQGPQRTRNGPQPTENTLPEWRNWQTHGP